MQAEAVMLRFFHYRRITGSLFYFEQRDYQVLT